MLQKFTRAIPVAAADPLMGLTEAFNRDNFDRKINLTIGSYRDNYGQPLVLKSVSIAKKMILNTDHEYAGIAGCGSFAKNTLDFALGKDNYDSDRFATIQTVSGTSACRVGAEFVKQFVANKVWLPSPTWANHKPIMNSAGLDVDYYQYGNDELKLDIDGMINDLHQLDNGNVVLLHVCGHNPTGIDPTISQWQQIFSIISEKQHLPFFDCAYQGFVSGDSVVDAYPLHLFSQHKHPFILAQSYSKNFGLYGERIGALSVFADNREAVLSQLKQIVRPMYSNPPINGAKIVNTILENDQLMYHWQEECRSMAERMINMRKLLRTRLDEKIPNRDWEFITDQHGMFCYSGFTPEMINNLREHFHIYMTKDGRINVAGINIGNIEYLTDSIAELILYQHVAPCDHQ